MIRMLVLVFRDDCQILHDIEMQNKIYDQGSLKFQSFFHYLNILIISFHFYVSVFEFINILCLPSLIVPPKLFISFCSGINSTIGSLVAGSISVELASYIPQTFRANEIRDN